MKTVKCRLCGRAEQIPDSVPGPMMFICYWCKTGLEREEETEGELDDIIEYQERLKKEAKKDMMGNDM